MLGEALSLLAAFLWAGSTIVAAKALRRIDPVSANALRTLFSSISMLIVAFAMWRLSDLFNLNLYGSIIVIIAAIIGFGLGDTLLYKSMGLIGLSRSYTIGYSYPFFVMAFATFFLGEPFLIKYLAGTVMIFIGIITIFLDPNFNLGQDINKKGFTMAFATAICWSVGTILVAFGLRSINIIQANMVRFPLLSLLLIAASKLWTKKAELDKRNLSLLFLSGILGMTLGGIVFLFSIQLIGASRAAPLSSSSPVWASLMSRAFLKEKISFRLLASALVVVAGTYFLV